ncbi:MAG: diguanylate cyclase [Aquabacterium sp.]|uniref:diguanylate cyclase domain-containing protein n=1 Tax=Aquabacterium sp. TaxID=1872578 RepID=UPI003BAFAD1C
MAHTDNQTPAYMGKPYRLSDDQEPLVDISRQVKPEAPGGERVVITFPASYLVSDDDASRFGSEGLLAFTGLDGIVRARRVGAVISSGDAVNLGDTPQQAEIAEVGRRIIDKLSHPYSLDGRHATVTTSVGAAVYPDNGDDEESMTRAADHVMYAAKSRGKNQLLFSTEQAPQPAC